MRNCKVCGRPIDAERLEYLPDTRTCTEHSKEKANVVYMEQSHKTAAYAVTIDMNQNGANEQLRLATRAFKRGR